MTPALIDQPISSKTVQDVLNSRPLKKVAILGANGTMGFQSAALFTLAGVEVVFLARTREKAQEGLAAAERGVRSTTVSMLSSCGSYDEDMEGAIADADMIFEAVAEDLTIKNALFDKVEKWRRDDSIVSTVTSGLSITKLAEGRSDSFRKNFVGLHFFNPPNVITGTEIIAGADTDPELVDYLELYCTKKLGRVMIRTFDTAGFAGNRVGFKVLNECAILAEEYGPLLIDRLVGPYTGRAMSPLATADLVGWDVHKAIVDNIHENAPDEVHATLKLPTYMQELIDGGTLGNKTGGGFFKRGEEKLVLDPKSKDYIPASSIPLPESKFIKDAAFLHSIGEYERGMAVFVDAPGDDAKLARKVIAGYIAYAFNRVGEATETITGIDLIMGCGFNWAPPSVLVDTIGLSKTVAMIQEAGLDVPSILGDAANAGRTDKFFNDPRINVGKFFVAK